MQNVYTSIKENQLYIDLSSRLTNLLTTAYLLTNLDLATLWNFGSTPRYQGSWWYIFYAFLFLQ